MMDITNIPNCLVLYCSPNNLFLYKKKIYESFSKEPILLIPTNTRLLIEKRIKAENNLNDRRFILSIKTFISSISFYEDLTYEECKKHMEDYYNIRRTVRNCEKPSCEIIKYE